MFSAFPFHIKRMRLERLDAFEPVGIKCGKDLPSTAGVVKDISRNGARIMLFQTAKLPNSIEIEFQHLGFSVKAQIQWHRKNDIGVQFEEPIDLDKMPLRLQRSRAKVVASYFKSNPARPKKAR